MIVNTGEHSSYVLIVEKCPENSVNTLSTRFAAKALAIRILDCSRRQASRTAASAAETRATAIISTMAALRPTQVSAPSREAAKSGSKVLSTRASAHVRAAVTAT